MLTLIIVLIFIGFYLWYATTNRMKVSIVFGTEVWSKKNQRASKILGFFSLLIGCGVAISHFGIGAGGLTFSIALMTIASLIILLMPLLIINKTTLTIVVLLCTLLEKTL